MRTSTKALIAMAVITVMVVGCSIVFVFANWVMYRNTTPVAEASGSYTAPTAPPSLSGEIESCSQPGTTRQTERGVEVCSPTEKWVLIPPNTPEVPTPATPQAAAPVTLTGIVEINPCITDAQPELQVEPLVENHQVVPQAFTGLDLNLNEVQSGVRYRVQIPRGTYSHLFVAVNDDNSAGNGLTYEIHGGDNVVAVNTAFTIWCKAGNYNPALAGQARVMNAKSLPTPLSDQWLAIPNSGIMPVPPVLGTTETVDTAGAQTPPTPTVIVGPACPAPTNDGWEWIQAASGNYWHLGPLPAGGQVKFVAPRGYLFHYSLAGQGKDPVTGDGATEIEGHEFSAFCQ